MQIKTTLRYNLTPAKIAITKKMKNNTCQLRCGEKEILLYCQWGYELLRLPRETVWRFPPKLKIELPYDL